MSSKLTPRQERALNLLKTGKWIARESIDHGAGASNGPGVISQLRSKLGDKEAIEMRLVVRVDRDGKLTRPGEYRIAPHALQRLAQLEAANDPQL